MSIGTYLSLVLLNLEPLSGFTEVSIQAPAPRSQTRPSLFRRCIFSPQRRTRQIRFDELIGQAIIQLSLGTFFVWSPHPPHIVDLLNTQPPDRQPMKFSSVSADLLPFVLKVPPQQPHPPVTIPPFYAASEKWSQVHRLFCL